MLDLELDWIGLNGIHVDLDWIGVDWLIGLSSFLLDWIGWNWIGLIWSDRIGLADWIGRFDSIYRGIDLVVLI